MSSNKASKRAAPQSNSMQRVATVYEARNTFRAKFAKYVAPANLPELDVVADLWFEGDARAFSFVDGGIVLHEVVA